MLFMHPLINLILWIIYLCGVGYAVYFIKDWRTLNNFGKVSSVASLACALAAMAVLVTIPVMPM